MTLILSGTDGLSDVDGSAATPAIRGTDANTGIFFPAADTIAFSEGGTEAMRIDSSGNVGIGTASPNASYKMSITGNSASIYSGILFTDTNAGGGIFSIYGESGALKFRDSSAGATRMTIDTSGNVGIGTSSPTAGGKLDVNGIAYFGTGDKVKIYSNNVLQTAGTLDVGTIGSAALILNTGNTERARITSGGAIWAGNTTRQSTDNHTFIASVTTGDWTTNFQNNAASGAPLGILIYYSAIAPNGTGSMFIRAQDSSATRFDVRSNGGIANYSANNANLSDLREKTNFAPAKSYLDTICAIPVQTFNYIDQNLEEDGGLTLGVVAQDVQAVAPEMVMESNWGTEEEPKMRLSIYQTDLQYALMKCIQEQQAIITQLQADVAALQAPQGTP